MNTTPRVLLLMQAMGVVEGPVYAHLPLIVNEKRQKLSKRRDDVAVGDYRARGFLPEALRNYLITLGWGPRDGQEIAPIESFVEQFELADINNSPAFFDLKKLEHFNGEYIRALPVDEFIERARPVVPDGIPVESVRTARSVRAATARDARRRRNRGAPGVGGRRRTRAAGEGLEEDHEQAARSARFSISSPTVWRGPIGPPSHSRRCVLGVGEELSTRSQLPVRLAVTGSRTGMPLFEPMAELDRDDVIARRAQGPGPSRRRGHLTPHVDD